MSAESILPESSNPCDDEESMCEEEGEDDSKTSDSVNTGQILPVEDSEILPFTVCESVFPEKETEKDIYDSSLQADKGCGKYTINNYMYERERQRFYPSTGEAVVYLRCTKAKNHGCKKARAVLVMDRDGTVKVRKCAENEEHTHPPPIEDILRSKVKMKLKAMIRSHPGKTAKELYDKVVKEEYDSYAELDPDFSRLIPSYEGVRTFIHRERTHMKQEEEVRLALTERGEPPIEDGKALRTKWKRITGELPLKNQKLKAKKKPDHSSKDYTIIPHNRLGITNGDYDVTRKSRELKILPDSPDGGSFLEAILDTSQPSSTVSSATSTQAVTSNGKRSKKLKTEPQEESDDTSELEISSSNALTPVMAGDPYTYSMAQGDFSMVESNTHTHRRYDLLGKNWAEKLKALRNDQRIFAEKLINDVFYEGEWCRLGHGCNIQNSS